MLAAPFSLTTPCHSFPLFSSLMLIPYSRLVPVILGAMLVLSACGSSSETAESPTAANIDTPEEEELGLFVRDIAPFPVLDADSNAFAHPFLGGFNTPRPQFVDINGNGHPDLFVQEHSGQLMFFRNEGGAESARSLTWQTDRFQDIDVGEWFRFVDVNQNGVYDLLAESPYNYIRYYRNVGTRTEPQFELAADTLRDAEGEAIFSDRQNIPNITDLNCDGMPDLLLGRQDGTITHYRAESFDDEGVPVFQHVEDRFEGIEIVEEFANRPSMRHGANSLTFADVNEDDHIDLLWGDFFESGLLYFENRGSCGRPAFINEPTPFPPPEPASTSGYNAPALTDWTGNGRLDLFIGVLGGAYDPNSTLDDNFYFYEAGSNGQYTKRTERFLNGIDVGSETNAAFGDLTGNGAPDMLIANRIAPDDRQTSHITLYENTGTASAPQLEARGILDLPDSYHYAPALADLTGDGQLDLIAGMWNGDIAVHPNTSDETGDPVSFATEPMLTLELPRGGNANPALLDVTGDGQLDIVAGASNGRLYVFENTSDGTDVSFTAHEDHPVVADVKRDRRSAPAFADLTGNGRPDLVVGAEQGGLVMHRNVGEEGAPAFASESESLPVIAPALVTPSFVNLKGGEHPALVIGTEGGGLQYYHITDTL